MLTFFGAVWISIVVGIFLIALVLGCTFDRHGQESPKWIITIGFIAFLLWAWPHPLDWRVITWTSVWTGIAIYLGIGLAYSFMEFIVDIRKSKRYWSERWKGFNVKYPKVKDSGLEVGDDHPEARHMTTDEQRKYKVDRFLHHHNSNSYAQKYRIIGIGKTDDEMDIEPSINKVRLAENVGCWTFWWPFYLVGLVLGDLLVEVFQVVADFFAGLSGRFVKMSFKNVFR